MLDRVSLQTAEGEIVAIVGPSGCGKSTLLLLAGGFLIPTNGAVLYEGTPVRAPDRRRILLTQSDSTWPWKTALENVAYPLRCQGMKPRAAEAEALRWLTAVGLDGAFHSYPATLSGGMKQRVGMAKVFALKPSLLLLDEPFSALDEITRRTANQVFLNLWRENRMTTVLVTHSIDEALFLADRIVVLSGRPAHVVGNFPVPHPRSDQIDDLVLAEQLRMSVLSLLQSAVS